MAHAYLGRGYANLDESDLSSASITRAWRLRDRVSDREKFAIDTRYEALVTGNLENTREISEAWIRTYPRDPQPYFGLANYYQATGQYEKAATESMKAIEAEPDFSIAYWGLAAENVDLDRLEEAENTLERAGRRGLEIDEFIMLDYDIAFLKHDPVAMQRAAARARGRSGGDNWISAREASALAYSGRLQQARNLTERAATQAREAGQQERGGLWEAGAAVREALFGNPSEAMERATAALKLSKDREVEYGAALALALLGPSSKADQLASDLAQRFPEDTSVQFSYLPVFRAVLALNHQDPAKALTLLETAAPNELGVPRSRIHALFGALCPVYVRGEAYLMERRGAEAAIEFQKIRDHNGIVVNDPIGALARLQLGRAYAQSRDKLKARSAYQNFLTLWKDADSNIPILKQAKAEFASLQ